MSAGGYRRLHALLRREGYIVNHKRLFRLYREERLMVRRRGGRNHARMPGPCRRYLNLGGQGRTRAQPTDRHARQAPDDRERQRHRADLERHPALGR